MKRLFFTVVATTLLSISSFAAESNPAPAVNAKVEYSKGTCTMHFTAITRNGYAYSWTETVSASSASDCNGKFEARLAELNS